MPATAMQHKDPQSQIKQSTKNNERPKMQLVKDPEQQQFQVDSLCSKQVQWITTLGAFVLLMQAGILAGWPSPNIARLTSPSAPAELRFTDSEVSWLVALPGVGGMIGGVIGLFFVSYYGGRRTILLSLLLFSSSWLCLILARSFGWIYASRFLGGLGFTVSQTGFSIHLGEVIEPRMRGTCIKMAVVGVSVGLTFATVAETYLRMNVSSSIYLIVCLLDIAAFTWLDDSPYFYSKMQEEAKAIKAIVFYSGSELNVDEELCQIKSYLETSGQMSLRDKLRELRKPYIWKSMLLILVLCALPVCSGAASLTAYTERTMDEARFKLVPSSEFVIYYNLASIVAACVTVNLIDKFGRRVLFAISGIGTALGMIGLGAHFYLLEAGWLDEDGVTSQVLPIVAVMVYSVAFAIGYDSVPFAMLSELLPDSVKSLASLVLTLTMSLMVALVTKLHLPAVNELGEACVFWGYSFMTLLAVPTAVFLMPETKGKSLQQIQNQLTGSSS